MILLIVLLQKRYENRVLCTSAKRDCKTLKQSLDEVLTENVVYYQVYQNTNSNSST